MFTRLRISYIDIGMLTLYYVGFYTTARKPHLYFTCIQRMTAEGPSQAAHAEYKLAEIDCEKNNV